MPKFISKRYVKAIKEVLNSVFNSKDSIHKDLARLIRSYSHRPLVNAGSYLISRKLNYFVITKVCSSHFVQGFFCPARLRYNQLNFWHEPDIWFKSKKKTKKLMNAFSDAPFVKERRHRFFLTRIKKHESLHTLAEFA